ncbi:MAG: two pore domain potassium channel family protein [Gammaproteobacteria bacterium]|nr:two pore domain potassium channel family protein [Gammaproteobacteria bacterium]
MLVVFLIIIGAVTSSVAIHYEFLYRLTVWMPVLKIRHRRRIVAGVFTALAAHTIEIIIFAIAYYTLNRIDGLGSLQGNFDGSLADCIYYSFTTYTTLGFGDIEPFGGIRFLSGIESLTGLLLITWTASFLYMEMRQYWDSS